MFDPTDHSATSTSFRSYGPIKRFDHHRSLGKDPIPTVDPDRSIYYAASTFSGCLVEVFGDSRLVEFGSWHVAYPSLTRDLVLLELRGNGAMRAGSIAALSSTGRYDRSQAWSCYFYDNVHLYGRVDGIVYPNAHNQEDAVVLYERASSSLLCGGDRVYRLSDSRLLTQILRVAEDHDMVVEGF